jgi:hypothetical protein
MQPGEAENFSLPDTLNFSFSLSGERGLSSPPFFIRAEGSR